MAEVNPNWTLEEACAANAHALQKDPRIPSRIQPLFRWVALQELVELERCFIAGDKRALLDAISQCAIHEIVMPDWVASGYLAAFRKFSHYKEKTLGEAFGVSQPKGKHLNALRKKREKGIHVWLRVREESEKGSPIDDGLFETIGLELRISGSLVRDYYYDEKKRLGTYTK